MTAYSEFAHSLTLPGFLFRAAGAEALVAQAGVDFEYRMGEYIGSPTNRLDPLTPARVHPPPDSGADFQRAASSHRSPSPSRTRCRPPYGRAARAAGRLGLLADGTGRDAHTAAEPTARSDGPPVSRTRSAHNVEATTRGLRRLADVLDELHNVIDRRGLLGRSLGRVVLPPGELELWVPAIPLLATRAAGANGARKVPKK